MMAISLVGFNLGFNKFLEVGAIRTAVYHLQYQRQYISIVTGGCETEGAIALYPACGLLLGNWLPMV